MEVEDKEEDIWDRASRPSVTHVSFDGIGPCNTPHDACETGNLAAFEKMAKRSEFNPDKGDSVGRTPLMWASENGHDKLVRACLRFGATVDKVDINQGRTALHLAARKGNVECLKLLIEALPVDKRDDELNREDNNGITPIYLAGQLSREQGGETMKHLISEGARYNANKMSVKTAGTTVMAALRWKRKGAAGGGEAKGLPGFGALKAAAAAPAQPKAVAA